MKPVLEMTHHELDDLEKQIEHRRIQIAASEVEKAGLHTRLLDGIEYVLVYSPIEEFLNVFATPQECRHLMDFLANLAPEEAYRRWHTTVTDKFPAAPYTRSDAIRDTRQERAEIDAQLERGEIDSREHAEFYRTSSFMDLVE